MDNCVEYILCHGSGNRFVMIDGVEQCALLQGIDLCSLARLLCDKNSPMGGSDGLLMVVRYGEGYAMRMFNPDGSEAEMCGNGIRCAARLIRERYIAEAEFDVWSGGKPHHVTLQEEIGEGLPTFGVDIAISLTSRDFPLFAVEGLVGKEIASLDEDLRFTALNLGNPHIVARVERVDMAQLESLGERVKNLREVLPNGVNVSLYEVLSEGEIFVATYERGAGITYSCGTAMTASATAAALLSYVPFGESVRVLNRGGMVRCMPNRNAAGEISTRLTGNATYVAKGSFVLDDGRVTFLSEQHNFRAEVEAYERFAKALSNDIKRN